MNPSGLSDEDILDILDGLTDGRKKPDPRGPWRQRVWLLREEWGGKCQECGAGDYLEFAHIGKTSLLGRGRGQTQRYRDIKQNPEKYRLVCKPCHRLMDRGKGKKNA